MLYKSMIRDSKGRFKRKRKRVVGSSVAFRMEQGITPHWKGKTKNGKGRVVLGMKGKMRVKRMAVPISRGGKRLMVMTEQKSWIQK
jgi:hypothetical protein